MNYNFRKRPIVIQAFQITESARANFPKDWPTWLKEAFDKPSNAVNAVFSPNGLQSGPLMINTLEGCMKCDIDSWIIQGVVGELYPCNNAIFTATYEPAENKIPPFSAKLEAVEKPKETVGSKIAELSNFKAVAEKLDKSKGGL